VGQHGHFVLDVSHVVGVALAGASYHGIGVPACINSAQKAAAALAE
jgi:protoporphyrinogen oxidase